LLKTLIFINKYHRSRQQDHQIFVSAFQLDKSRPRDSL